MSSNGFKREPEKETIYNGHTPATAGTVYQGPPVPQTVGRSVQGAPARGETVYQGPSGGTVFDPAKYAAAKTNDVIARESAGRTATRMGLWFYVIAGLSFLNSLAAMGGATLGFSGGLGITRQLDLAGKMESGPGPYLAASGAIAGVFVLIGIFAQRRSKAAFLIGFLLYGLDTLLLCFDGLLLQFRPILIHAFITYKLYRTYGLMHDLEALDE